MRRTLTQCKVCRKWFLAASTKQTTCPLRQTGRHCTDLARSTALRGTFPQAVRDRRGEVIRARARAAIREQFGELSDREIELIRIARKKFYQDGYQACRRYYLRFGDVPARKEAA